MQNVVQREVNIIRGLLTKKDFSETLFKNAILSISENKLEY